MKKINKIIFTFLIITAAFMFSSCGMLLTDFFFPESIKGFTAEIYPEKIIFNWDEYKGEADYFNLYAAEKYDLSDAKIICKISENQVTVYSDEKFNVLNKYYFIKWKNGKKEAKDFGSVIYAQVPAFNNETGFDKSKMKLCLYWDCSTKDKVNYFKLKYNKTSDDFSSAKYYWEEDYKIKKNEVSMSVNARNCYYWIEAELKCERGNSTYKSFSKAYFDEK